MAPSHIGFAAEEDFSAFDRQDESFRPSVSRKRSARGRKAKLPYTPIRITIAYPTDLLVASRHFLPSSSAPLHEQRQHQLHKIFRI
jgi:hypothetical protein